MLTQLLLVKRLFLEAKSFTVRSDPVSSGVAISMLQDAIELYVWAVVKEKSLQAKDQASFTANLDLLQREGFAMPQVGKLLELNKSRVGFKHYGNLPAQGEALKFQTYVDDCLRDAMQAHFQLDFDSLSLVDLVTFTEVRTRLKSAEQHVANNEFQTALVQASISRKLLFSQLERYVPRVDSGLRDADRIVNSIDGVQGFKAFSYLTDYLDELRQLTIVSMARIPLDTYAFLQRTLPSVIRFQDGNWRTRPSLKTYDEQTCKRVIAELVDIAIRIQAVV
jgi:hypothetical protein